MTLRERMGRWLLRGQLGSVSARVDDSAGWGDLTRRGHDHDQSTIEKIYADALTAWRKNPIAWRIVAITTDFVVGDSITISSPDKALNDFIQRFWNNPQNRMALRLEPMCDELSRAGDLFVALFRNDQDGMSYIRFVTKDQIKKIVSAENDWETELAYLETRIAADSREWVFLTPPQSRKEPLDHAPLCRQPTARRAPG